MQRTTKFPSKRNGCGCHRNRSNSNSSTSTRCIRTFFATTTATATTFLLLPFLLLLFLLTPTLTMAGPPPMETKGLPIYEPPNTNQTRIAKHQTAAPTPYNSLLSPLECLCDDCIGIANISKDILNVHEAHFLNVQNDGAYDTCPVGIYNPDLHAMNVVEVDFDLNVIEAIRKDYEHDFEPHLGYSTDDICGVNPYGGDVWAMDDPSFRSDMKWYSVRNKAMFEKYERHVKATQLQDLFHKSWIHPGGDIPEDEMNDVSIYGLQFVVRSNVVKHHIHFDWHEFVSSQVITFLIPIRDDMNIHLLYVDVDGNLRRYKYQLGKGIGFAGSFVHGTDIGQNDIPEALFSIELGGTDPTLFNYYLDSAADEHEYYMHPTKGYIPNERYPPETTKQCLPTKEEVEAAAKAREEEEEDDDEEEDFDEEDDEDEDEDEDDEEVELKNPTPRKYNHGYRGGNKKRRQVPVDLDEDEDDGEEEEQEEEDYGYDVHHQEYYQHQQYQKYHPHQYRYHPNQHQQYRHQHHQYNPPQVQHNPQHHHQFYTQAYFQNSHRQLYHFPNPNYVEHEDDGDGEDYHYENNDNDNDNDDSGEDYDYATHLL